MALNLREWMRRIFLSVLITSASVVILTFLVDLGLFRLRVAANREPYGSVVVRHYYAVVQKNGKTQFLFDPPGSETCVNALLPHSGMQPCWYLRRHPDQRTDI